MVHVGKPGLLFYQALVNLTYANMQLMVWLMHLFFFSMESSEMSQDNIINLVTKKNEL